MRQERNTDQHGRVLQGGERNPNEWTIQHAEPMQGGVRICYVSSRKLSGASYVLELTHAELTQLLEASYENLPIGDRTNRIG